MYLIDTNVISESRKGRRADPGVSAFFRQAAMTETPLYISVVTVGELRRGVEIIRRRGDLEQAERLEAWLGEALTDYRDDILSLDVDIAQIWGRMRVPHPEHPLDKQIAATALAYNLTLVTRNTRDFQNTGVTLLNPFSPAMR